MILGYSNKLNTSELVYWIKVLLEPILFSIVSTQNLYQSNSFFKEFPALHKHLLDFKETVYWWSFPSLAKNLQTQNQQL